MKRSELPSQRYSEEEDLLERSTKISKEMTPGSSTSIDSDMTPAGIDEVVAETPLPVSPGTNPPVSEMQVEADSTPQAATTDEIGQTANVNPSPTDSGNANPRTYRDSVVGQGTDAAPFLIDSAADLELCPTSDARDAVNVPSDSAEAQPPDSGSSVHPAHPAGTSKGNASASRVAPYGSWMIVTRKDRRPPGRPAGQGQGAANVGQRAQTGKEKESSGTTGSRFGPLESLGVPETTPSTRDTASDHDVMEENVEREGPNQVMQRTNLGSRPRRNNVIANERQIENEPVSGGSTPAPVRDESARTTHRGGLRRAAEEDEHVVNRGENGGDCYSYYASSDIGENCRFAQFSR
nr:uncharacterized protein LOC109178450 [Ipomoea batatas]GME15783.1 uncharacterized protein LOC109178450 [Ipomoea batatas]